MLASEVGVKAARDVLRDKRGGRSLDCAAYKIFRLGVEAEARGSRKERDNDGLERKVLVVVVVVVVVEVIASSGQIGPRLKHLLGRKRWVAVCGSGSRAQNLALLVVVWFVYTRTPHVWALDTRQL